MFISWHGLSCVLLEGKGKDAASVLLDPYTPDGKVLRRAGDSIVVVTTQQEKLLEASEKTALSPVQLIISPGEYDVREVSINLFAAERSPMKAAAVITMDGIITVHLGGLQTAPSESFIEQFEHVDILTVCVGGEDGMSALAASNIVRSIEPHVVIPLRYRTETSGKNYGQLSAFLKEMGAAAVADPEARIKLEADEIRTFEMRVMVLRDQS